MQLFNSGASSHGADHSGQAALGLVHRNTSRLHSHSKSEFRQADRDRFFFFFFFFHKRSGPGPDLALKHTAVQKHTFKPSCSHGVGFEMVFDKPPSPLLPPSVQNWSWVRLCISLLYDSTHCARYVIFSKLRSIPPGVCALLYLFIYFNKCSQGDKIYNNRG